MEWHKIESTANHNVNFTRITGVQEITEDRVQGGIINCGAWAWIADNCTLRVISLKTGQIISTFKFHRNVYNCAGIVCVEELTIPKSINKLLLAVCLDILPDNGNETGNNSVIAIYSVENGCVLNFLQLPYSVTCMRFLNSKNCRRSLLQNFDGCLSVGTQDGVILALDLYLTKLLDIHETMLSDYTPNRNIAAPCQIVDYSLPITEIHRSYKKCLREITSQNIVHFGIQLEVVESPSAIVSLLPIHLIIGLAVGLNDGRIIVYDLAELQIFYASPLDHRQMPLVKMDFLEPPDDPRPCLYIMTMHENGEKLLADLHTLMYEKRCTDEQGVCYFENFHHGLRKLHLPLENSTSSAISCQAITKLPRNSDDDATCLCAISWYSILEEKNKLIVFDMNQWYKEEMPSTIHPNHAVTCLAAYYLNESQFGLQSFVNPATIAHFNSMQRCEEHFYPNSLTFDCLLLTIEGCRSFHWSGIQNITLNTLRASNATLFLEPDQMFESIRKTRLLPQFTELNINSLFSKNAKCEVILSVALEHNCVGLLRSCARSWADGSFTGNNSILPNPTVIELSSRTLINWIWKRATDIKMRCNELCKGLLQCGGYPLDQREKKELGFITRQLRNLADLLKEVLQQYTNNNLPEKALSNLASKHASLRLAADYQELLLWLINIGLLPESLHCILNDDKPTTSRLASRVTSSIYPYKQLRDYYAQKRSSFASVQESHISKKSGSCRLMFIDAFIEHECMRLTSKGNANASDGDTLREYWLENDGNGLYPPTTIESMLRIMLLPNISDESKYSILLYFFLDMRVALTDLEQEHGKDCTVIVENLSKFPSVFNLSQAIIKNIQSFWYLDHGNFLAAVDEFLSPFNNNHNYSQWLIELQVESLLTQNAAHLAIRILDAHPNLIAPILKLTILLANNLIAEAFHFARSKDDDELLKRFFISCLKMGKLGVILDLALTEHEGQLVEQLLKRSQLPGAENLHFVYLLQKSKYIEAVSYMDELAKGKCLRSATNTKGNTIDAPNLVMSAFNTTMTPVTQSITDVYFRIKNKVKQKEIQNRSPVPLSCQLIKQNANNLLGGIYHSSALSAHFATYYYDEELQFGRRDNQHGRQVVISPLSARNAPFLRKPQPETHCEFVDQLDRQIISYPQEYKPSEKRRLGEMQQEDAETATDAGGSEKSQLKQQPPNKRRRLVGDDLLKELKHFNQKKIVLNEGGLLNESFMMKPVEGMFNKQVTDEVDADDAVSVSSEQISCKPVAQGELHSILKFNTPEPIDSRKLRRGESPAIEEKTIRFILPPTTSLPVNKNESESKPNDGEDMKSGTQMQKEEGLEKTQYYSALSTTDKYNSLTSMKSVSNKDSGISIITKPLESQDSSISVYESLRDKSLSPKSSGPQPRKPLIRTSAEPENQTNFNLKSVRSSTSISIQKKNSEITESFKSITENVDVVEELPLSKPTTAFPISSVCTLTSNDFAPQICSSKVGEVQSKSIIDQVKFSERSTMAMTSDFNCDFDSMSSSKDRFVRPRPSLASVQKEIAANEKVVTPHLDTTLSMSSYDLTNLETTPTGLTAESRIVASLETNETKQIEQTSSEQLPYLTTTDQLEVSESSERPNDLQDVTMHESDVLSSDDDNHSTEKSKAGPEVIELLSSSDENSNDSDETDAEDEGEGLNSSDEEIETEDDIEDVDAEDEEEGEEEHEEDDYENDDDEDESVSDEAEEVNDDSASQHSASSSSAISENVKHQETDTETESDTHSNLQKRNLGDDNEEIILKLDDDISMEEQNLYKTDAKNDFTICEHVEEVKTQTSDEISLQKGVKISDIEKEGENMVTKSTSYEEKTTTNLAVDHPVAESSMKVSKENIEIQAKESEAKQNLQKFEEDKQGTAVPNDNLNKISTKESVVQICENEHLEILSVELTEELPKSISEIKESSTLSKEPSNSENKKRLERKSEILLKSDSHLLESAVQPMDSSIDSDKPIEETTKTTHNDNKTQNEIQESTSIGATVHEKHHDLDTSDKFETPNSSFLSVKETEEPPLIISMADNVDTESSILVSEPKISHDPKKKDDQIVELAEHKASNISPHSYSEKKDDKIGECTESKVSNSSFQSVKESDEVSSLEKRDSRNINDQITTVNTSSPSETEARQSKQNKKIEKVVVSNNNTPEKLNISMQSDKKHQSPIFLSASPSTTFKRGDRSRGQSLPPQSLFNAEENLETDLQTPKRRSKRGISVPPQAIDSAKLNDSVDATPTRTTSSAVRTQRRLSGRHSVLTVERDSPQSVNSSRESHSKRRPHDVGENTPFDSPALHTRSRVRTLSEASEATATSVNSPTTSLRRTRRSSISSNVSEQPQHSQTPKRSRRSSISGKSDTEGTPTSRRLLMKEVEEETQKTENTATSADNYLHSRRLTRNQRALLDKLDYKPGTSEHLDVKDDQVSVSSQLSQTSSRPKRRLSRSASINDDAEDDSLSVTSSAASELRRSSRRLRAQQQKSPSVSLSAIPEDEGEEGSQTRSKRSKITKK